jgi:hypothetical protein
MLTLTRTGWLLLAFFVAGCASPTLEEGAAPEFASEGLAAVRNSGFAEAYVLPGANLPGYGIIDFSPMSVAGLEVTQTTMSGTTRGQWLMTPEREAGLQQTWSDATARAFRDYPRADPGQGTVRIDAALTRVAPGRTASTATSASGAMVQGTSDIVEVSAEFRLVDAASGQLLAVIRDRRAISSLQWTRAAGIDSVNLFNSWAALLHTRVSGN